MEMFGTKWPSMTSTWMRSAPARSASRTCSPRRVKSAARQDLARQLRQQRPGQDVVDVAGAGLDLLAAAGDRRDQLVVEGQRRLVVLAHAVLDALELQLDDLLNHLVGQREKRHDRHAAEQG